MVARGNGAARQESALAARRLPVGPVESIMVGSHQRTICCGWAGLRLDDFTKRFLARSFDLGTVMLNEPDLSVRKIHCVHSQPF
jgi:hypothetical protein